MYCGQFFRDCRFYIFQFARKLFLYFCEFASGQIVHKSKSGCVIAFDSLPCSGDYSLYSFTVLLIRSFDIVQSLDDSVFYCSEGSACDFLDLSECLLCCLPEICFKEFVFYLCEFASGQFVHESESGCVITFDSLPRSGDYSFYTSTVFLIG